MQNVEVIAMKKKGRINILGGKKHRKIKLTKPGEKCVGEAISEKKLGESRGKERSSSYLGMDRPPGLSS